MIRQIRLYRFNNVYVTYLEMTINNTNRLISLRPQMGLDPACQNGNTISHVGEKLGPIIKNVIKKLMLTGSNLYFRSGSYLDMPSYVGCITIDDEKQSDIDKLIKILNTNIIQSSPLPF